MFGILIFSKPKRKAFNRHIWIYEQGNYDLLKEKASKTDWDEDINKYTENVTEQLIENAKQCIPNRLIKVNPMEPTWITSNIKRQIRKRKRLYKKAKRANNPDLCVLRSERSGVRDLPPPCCVLEQDTLLPESTG